MSMATPVKLQRIISEFETLRVKANSSNVVSVDLMLVILEVGKGNGISGRDVEELLDISTSKASRILDILRTEKNDGARGYGLVDEKSDPTNHRTILRYPNAKLKAFMKRVDSYLEE